MCGEKCPDHPKLNRENYDELIYICNELLPQDALKAPRSSRLSIVLM